MPDRGHVLYTTRGMRRSLVIQVLTYRRQQPSITWGECANRLVSRMHKMYTTRGMQRSLAIQGFTLGSFANLSTRFLTLVVGTSLNPE